MKLHLVTFCLSVFVKNVFTTSSIKLDEVVFVILSQSNYLHAKLGDVQREKLKGQLKEFGVKQPKVFDLHNDWKMHGT
jgi:hypothetical protein